MRNRRIGGVLLAALLCGVGAKADFRTDFFDAGQRPEVHFDKNTLTWRLRNKAIERVIRFDSTKGSLQTLAVRDLQRGREIKPVPGSEGQMTFAAPLKEPPQLLSGWKITDFPQAQGWNSADYVEKPTMWTPVTLPFTKKTERSSVWMRCAIPKDRMIVGRAYALIFQQALPGEAEIYVDGQLAERVPASQSLLPRTIQVDLLPKNRQIAIRLVADKGTTGLKSGVGIAEVGTAPPPIDLNSDWRYVLYSNNATGDGSETLTINLSGIRKYEGFELAVHYQICPGAEPTLARWFTFLSHRQTRFLLEQVTYEKWPLPSYRPETVHFPGTGFVAADAVNHEGLLTAVLSPLGDSERSEDGNQVSTVLRPYYLLKPDIRQLTPKALMSFFRGTTATGAFLYQLYNGQYVALGNLTTVPTTYHTKYGYGKDLNALLCEKIIPLASQVGAKLFLLHDGWQANGEGKGTYGDWNVDRSKNKFPEGLGPISTLVRTQQMKFGLWADPIGVSPDSRVVREHPEWLVQTMDGKRVSTKDYGQAMCFTSGWQEAFSLSMVQICRELSASALRLDGEFISDGCTNPAHEHPVLHSRDAQGENGLLFEEKMRRVDPAFLFMRGYEAGPETTAWQHTGWFAEWEGVTDPKQASDPMAWYKNADLVRRGLYDVQFTRPTFTLSAEAPVHLPTPQIQLDALEYSLVSAAASAGNLELSGLLDKSSPTERDLVKKWVLWNEENRPWLAFTQPLTSLSKPWNPLEPGAKPHVDGVLHLRNALNGRYGYLCLWNPGDKAEKTSVRFQPADYFVRGGADSFRLVRMKDGKEMAAKDIEGAVTLTDFTLAPRSWEIIELRRK